MNFVRRPLGSRAGLLLILLAAVAALAWAAPAVSPAPSQAFQANCDDPDECSQIDGPAGGGPSADGPSSDDPWQGYESTDERIDHPADPPQSNEPPQANDFPPIFVHQDAPASIRPKAYSGFYLDYPYRWPGESAEQLAFRRHLAVCHRNLDRQADVRSNGLIDWVDDIFTASERLMRRLQRQYRSAGCGDGEIVEP